MHFRPARAVTVIVILANLFVCSLVGVSLHASYAQYHDRAAITSRNTNRLVAQTIEDEIRRIDFGLRVVADDLVCASWPTNIRARAPSGASIRPH